MGGGVVFADGGSASVDTKNFGSADQKQLAGVSTIFCSYLALADIVIVVVVVVVVIGGKCWWRRVAEEAVKDIRGNCRGDRKRKGEVKFKRRKARQTKVQEN